MANVDWGISVTRQFTVEQLADLQSKTAAQLIQEFLEWDDITVFRALFELFAHGEKTKLREVNANEGVRAKWEDLPIGWGPDLPYLMCLTQFFSDIPAD